MTKKQEITLEQLRAFTHSSLREVDYFTTATKIMGCIIAALRESVGLSQAQFAETAGFTQSALARLEVGDTVINVEHLLQIGNALKIKPNSLLEIADNIQRDIEAAGVKVLPKRVPSKEGDVSPRLHGIIKSEVAGTAIGKHVIKQAKRKLLSDASTKMVR